MYIIFSEKMGMSLPARHKRYEEVLNAILDLYGNTNFARYRKCYIDEYVTYNNDNRSILINGIETTINDYFIKNKRIVVVSRTGGGNRDEYEDDNIENHSHPLFISDEDDHDDCTYAHFSFYIPKKYQFVVDYEELLTMMQNENEYPSKDTINEIMKNVNFNDSIVEFFKKYITNEEQILKDKNEEQILKDK